MLISQALRIPYGTVKNWCRKIDLNIDLSKEHRGGPHNVIITPAISRYIVESLGNEKWITMLDLSGVIVDVFGIKVARSTLSAHVHSTLGLSYKLNRALSERRNCDDVKESRVAFVEWIMMFMNMKLITSLFTLMNLDFGSTCLNDEATQLMGKFQKQLWHQEELKSMSAELLVGKD